MSDLSEFLLARIAEDENVARSVQDVPAKSGSDVFTSLSAPTGTVEMAPRRVLAECEVKRRIVEGFLDAERAVATYDHDHPTDAYWQEWGNRHALALAVELLALPYADRPDYRPEWRH